MKPSSFLKRVAAAAVTVFFFIAGAPALYAADTTHNISSGPLAITSDGNYIVEGGGTTTSNNISVDSGVTATITLKSVSISSGCALVLKSNATVTLILKGTNTLTSSSSAGILVPSDSTLIIKNSSTGGGSVKAAGAENAAGIGGGNGGSGGTVIISGGTVTANGGGLGAGIGGGYGGSGGTIEISGGTVTANGSMFGAGVGGGQNGSGGTVTISGGSVTATGGDDAAGIGGGATGNGGTVTISGSNTAVTVKGGVAGHDIGTGLGAVLSDGGTLTVGDGVRLTLVSGMDNSILPVNVTLGDCTVDGDGAGSYARTYIPPVTNTPSNSDEPDAPVFFRSTTGSGVEIDLSALALPAGVTLVSKDFSGLPTQSAGKVWTLSQRLVGTNGTLQGKDYLALYELSLTDENGKALTGYIGRVTVRLPIPSGSNGTLHLLYLNESSGGITEMVAVRDGDYLTYSSTHFSSYLITNNGGNSAGEKPTIPETGAPSFPYAAAGAVVVLILISASILRKKLKQ